MKFKNLLFDLDGTLLNSYEGIYNSFVYAFKKNNKDLPKEGVRAFIGPPLVDSFKSLYPDNETVNNMVESYREHYLPIGQFESKLYDGVVEMLDKLSKKGYKLYMATCKPVKIANEILKPKK
jgi:phosphoglycolate phosphatase